NVFTAQDPLVAGMKFVSELKVQLKNKIIFHFFLGSTKEKNYLRVQTMASEVPTEVSISTETDTEEIKLIEEMANAKKMSEQFNRSKGNLVFETTEKLFEILDNLKL
ncbi:hypothetical protein N9N67_10380, partial [Bacteriovoracaceae bacterium]|nr:hypothetical protein [Bacteriovoracaceae bacterium]